MAFLGFLNLISSQFDLFDKGDAVRDFTRENRLPGVHNWELQQRSLVAQDHTTIRLPFGGNEQYQRTVADGNSLLNDDYQRAYQMNLLNLKVNTVEARLPGAGIITESNKFVGYPHTPEASFQKIEEFRKERESQPKETWPK